MAFIDLDREAPAPQDSVPTSRQKLWLGAVGVGAVSIGLLVGSQLSPSVPTEMHGISRVDRGKVAMLESVEAAMAHAVAAKALEAITSAAQNQ